MYWLNVPQKINGTENKFSLERDSVSFAYFEECGAMRYLYYLYIEGQGD